MSYDNKAYCKQWRLKNLERRKVYQQQWITKNRKRINASSKAWREKHPEIVAASHKRHYLENRKRLLAEQKLYRQQRRELNNAYRRKRFAIDPAFRMLLNLRGRLTRALKGLNKTETTKGLLGCSMEDFRLHIESNWEPKMSWSNYGKKEGQWSLDHMIPCALFDLSKPEHQKRCFHFSNIRPMWAIPNMQKGKKIVTNQYNLL